MTNKPLNLFHAMFQILDSIYDTNKDEELLVYLSDANYTLCVNGKSTDPLVYDCFEKEFNKKCNEFTSDYDFIIYYLQHLDPYYGDIKKYFTQIPRAECEAKLTELLK